MLWRPPEIEPAIGSAAPSVIFCTSRNTAEFPAAAITSFPSCVTRMPVGAADIGTTRTRSTFPADRFSTAMPGVAPRPPMTDTNSQHPSCDGSTMKGGPGRETVADGEAAGASQSPVWACATMVSAVVSSVQEILLNMRRLYSPQLSNALGRNLSSDCFRSYPLSGLAPGVLVASRLICPV